MESTKADTDTSCTMIDAIGNAELKNKDEESVIIESNGTRADENESIDRTNETIDGNNEISLPNVLEQTQEDNNKIVDDTKTDDFLNITETSTAYESYQQQQQQSRRRRKVFGTISLDNNNIADSANNTTPHSTNSTNVVATDQSIKIAFQDILTLATPKSPQYESDFGKQTDNDRHVNESCTNDDDNCSNGHEQDMEKMNCNDEEDGDEIDAKEEIITAEDGKDDSQKIDNNQNTSEQETILITDDQLAEMNLNSKETDLSESCASAHIQMKSIIDEPEMEQMFANEGELNEDAVLQSTEYLFSTVTDKLTVTVKDIVQSLCAEYNVKKLGKKIKNAVRQKLIELIEEEQNADTNETSDKEYDSVDGQSNKTDDEQNSHNNDEDASIGADDDDVASRKNRDDDDFDPVEEGERSRRVKSRRKRVVAKKRRQSSDSGDDNDDDEGDDDNVGDSIGTNRKPRKINMKIKKSALRIHHEQLRKRRLEELRVRNEELQVLASKKDQERAELIAAKFDTNRTEMRLQRLENRLDLLQKLDQQRIKCISATPPRAIQPKCQIPVKDEKECKQPIVEQVPLDVCKVVNAESLSVAIEDKPSSNADIELDNDSDSDDDDDLELVVLDGTGKQVKATVDVERKHIPEEYNHIMSILDLADQEPNSSRFNTKPKHRMSPRRCVNARANLRQQLLSKQRSMGNEWLARELGYKSQAEHLRDCQEAEQKKRETTIKREEIRIKENERRLLRERMIKLDQQQYEETNVNDPNNNDDDDKDDSEYTPDDGNKETNPNVDDSNIEDEDDDEELELARIISEQQKTNEKVASDAGDESIHDGSRCNEEKLEDEQNLNDASDCKNVEAKSEILTNAISSIQMAQTLPNDNKILGTATRNDDELPTCTPDLENDDRSHHSSLGITIVPRHLDREGNEEQLDEEEALTDIVDAEVGDDGDQSIETNDSKDKLQDDQSEGNEKIDSKPKVRNSAWRAMLEKDKEKERKKKRSALVEEEAEEEEEEQVAGLEDFGFTVNKKRNEDGDEADDVSLDEDDLEDVVDELSDNEGDEEAGDVARKAMEKKEEKERHKEMLRRLRDGYDGRRGGIAAANGARGVHRFDQLVAADNKDDAKRLGLANDDEFDSDSDDDEKKKKKDGEEGGDNTDDEDDEAALIDKMLKDRFLHRNNNDDDAEQENFSEDDNDDDKNNKGESKENEGDQVDEEEKEQERIAKRFAKRARMQRLLEAHEHDQEFSQMKLIEEDTSFKIELQMMRNGLARKRSTSSSQPSIISSNGASSSRLLSSSATGTVGGSCSILNGQDENSNPNHKKQKTNNKKNNEKSDQQQQNNTLTSSIFTKGGCLALALQNNRTSSKRTSFVRTTSNNTATTGSSLSTSTSTGFRDTAMVSSSSSSSYMKSIAFNHVVFNSINDNSKSNSRSSNLTGNNTKNSTTTSSSNRIFPSSLTHRPIKSTTNSTAMSSSRESLFTRSVMSNTRNNRTRR